MLLMILVTLLLVPGILFTTGAGFAFGLLEGVVYVVIGTTLGAVLAFLIARHLMGERAAQFVRSHSRLQHVSQELVPEGWKIIMLTRLVPFFPFKVSNYFFGLTGFSLRGFTLGTLAGIIPFSLHNVYLGSIAADIALLGAGESAFTPLQWALYGSGFIVVVVLVLYINRLARRALARYTDDTEPGEV
ncbi:TVP38/TMEM64 family protein [Kineobactrum sediminis]|nr:VTT domain-containing protein [Kineobactrum sediminis]